ncbi:MAG: LamG-like jellyroll fold domain-containing protein [Thermodesulfobacteriota bacterium]|nr:LamG-like jellyroll fold domain-containing protein [Thermodesulfobacteriota bacterium]
MMRSLKIFWVLCMATGFVAIVGGDTLLMASSGQSHATHFVSQIGPLLPLNETGCSFCHAAGNRQCEESPVFADDEYLADTGVCDACHSQGGMVDGVAMAKANWADGVYEPGGSPLQAGKESWCISCHDAGTSVCDGVSAPDISGDNTTYGYYVNGHRSRLCSDCHDLTMVHIDGEARTYAFNMADYAPDESGVSYAIGYRLKSMGADDPGTDYDESVPLMVPTNFGTTFSYVGQDIRDNAFRLCFSCHDKNEVLDDTPGDGLDTNFKAALPDPPLAYSYSSGDSNQHVLHVIGQTMQAWDSDWDLGTTGPGPGPGYDTLMTCSACHNVHGAAATEGSTNEPMIRDGTLAGRTGYGFSYVVEDGAYPQVISTGASLPSSVGAVFRNGNALCSTMCHLSPTPPGASYDATGSGSGTYLEYYRALEEATCDTCHAYGTEASHPSHGDSSGKGVEIGCYDCHAGDHVDNTVGLVGGDLAATAVCDPCHSQGGAYDGLAMAKAEWGDGIYETDGQSLKSGNETWCVGCHDSEGATIDGRTAKDIAGDDAVYGYYASGHGKYNIACLECHDPQYTHIDAYARTYEADEDMDGPRGYQQGYRLKSVNGMRPFYLPRLSTSPDPPPSPYTSDWMDPNHFALCYDCHIVTKIQGAYLDKFSLLDPLANGPRSLHWSDPGTKWPDAVGSHLGMASNYWDSDRKNSNTDSAFSCPTCHDPHSKKKYAQTAGFELADTRANLSMTRQDMGILNVREVRRSFGLMSSSEWAEWGGDLACQDACHPPSFGDVDPGDDYSFRLGTRPPESPKFWTQLNGPNDITNPTFGSGGTVLGPPTFEEYTDVFGNTQSGMKVDALDEGAQLPTGNLNIDDEVYGETIDFWYTPDFDVTGHTGEEYLFHCYYDDNNWIVIQVINDMLLFQIRSNGADNNLRTEAFHPWNSWTAGTARNIVCTWGPAHGMHMYVDGPQMVYSQSGGLDDTTGIVQLPETVFYIGNDKDGGNPANGVIDDFKIYGYQYQDFSAGGPVLFSKFGSASEISNPVVGIGGTASASTAFNSTSYLVQHGSSAAFTSSHPGVVQFLTTNLNNAGDTIDFWYRPSFELFSNGDTTKHLFRCYVDGDNYADIKVYNNRFQFRIRANAVNYRVRTKPIGNGYDGGGSGMWYHIVCTWGSQGMRMYINDEEPELHPDVQEGLAYTGSLMPNGMPTYFQMGNKAEGASNYCYGYIDELRVYGYQAVPQRPDYWVPVP